MIYESIELEKLLKWKKEQKNDIDFKTKEKLKRKADIEAYKKSKKGKIGMYI